MKTTIISCLLTLLTFFSFSIVSAAGLDLDRSFAPMLRYNGNVNVSDIIVQPDGKFIVAGNMYLIDNRQVNGIARYNADNTLDTTFDAAGAIVNQGGDLILALQPDGKIIVGGNFTVAGGQTRLRFARLNQNGSLDPSFSVPFILSAGAPSSIAVQPDGKIIAVLAGGFQIGGATYSAARLNADGSIDNSFVPFSNSSSSSPSKVYIQPDGKLIFVGSQMVVGGQTRTNILRLNANAALDTAFNVALNVGGVINAASILPDGKILIAGTFSTVGGQTRTNLARLNADSSLDASFGNNSARINNIQRIGFQTDGKIIYTGASDKLFRDNTDGTADADFTTRSRILDDSRSFAVLPDNRIAAGGNVYLTNVLPPNFSDVRYQPLILLAADGTLDEQFRPNVLFPYALGDIADIAVQPDGKILLGSELNSDSNTMSNSTRRSLARLNSNGTFDTTFAFPNTFLTGGGRVTQVELLPDGKILIGTLSTNTNRAVVRLNADGTPDTAFPNVTISGLNQKILYLAVQTDGKILIQGSFTQINGQARQGFARLNADGTLDAAFNPIFANASGATTNIYVFSARLQADGKILVAGNFERVNGAAQKWQARLNADGSLDTSFITSPFSNFNTLLAIQPDGKILMTYQGNLLRFNTDGSLDNAFTRLTFYQSANVTGNLNGAITLPSGKIFVYGNFTYLNASGNPDALGYAVLNADGTLDRGSLIKPGAFNQSTVLTAAINGDGKIYIGGGFTFVNNISQPALARLNAFTPTAALFDFDGDGKADVSVFRSGTWYINPSASAPNGFYGVQFGFAADTLAPADYDGDGKIDIAVWRAGSFAYFYILNSSNNTFRAEQFGRSGDNPTVAGDWDGDGRADLAVYRPGTNGGQSYFYYRPSAQTGVDFNTIYWGTSGDTPIFGDFDGDRKLDATVYRPGENAYYVRRSSDGATLRQQWGNSATDAIFAGDFDGDGKSDFAVQRFSGADAGTWYVLQSGANPAFRAVRWGLSSDVSVPADYTGDGRTDFAVFRRSNGTWYVLDGATGAVTYTNFGASGDFPLPLNLVR